MLPFQCKSSTSTPVFSKSKKAVKESLFNISDFFDSQVKVDGESESLGDGEETDCEVFNLTNLVSEGHDITTDHTRYNAFPTESPEILIGRMRLKDLEIRFVNSQQS